MTVLRFWRNAVFLSSACSLGVALWAQPGYAQANQAVPAPSEAAPVRKKAATWRPSTIFTWDLNIDGALGGRFLSPAQWSGFGRVRGGLLIINEQDLAAPKFYSLGMTYELSDFSPATFGLQLEAMSLKSGSWVQLGALVDVQPRPGFMAALGWSLFGLEVQARWDNEREGAIWGLYGKLRVPVSMLVYAFR